MATSANWDMGDRSPLTPSEPFSWIHGTTPLLIISMTVSSRLVRTPEQPFASTLARRSIAARTASSGNGLPVPAEWL